MKESYMAQNSLELKLPIILWNTKNSHTQRKKMDIKVDYAQLAVGPASGWSPEFLAPAVEEITTPNNLEEEQAPLRQ